MKALTGDLDATMTDSMSNKQTVADAQETLLTTKNEAAKHLDKLRSVEVEAAGLKVTLENEQRERNIEQKRKDEEHKKEMSLFRDIISRMDREHSDLISELKIDTAHRGVSQPQARFAFALCD